MKTLRRIEHLLSVRNLVSLAIISVSLTVVAFSFSIANRVSAIQTPIEAPQGIRTAVPTFTPVAVAQSLTTSASARYEVGADTGTMNAVAYTSNSDGDAYVEIQGNTIYARAQLNGCQPCSGPVAAAPTPVLIAATATPTGPVFTVAVDSANLRASPWGDVLGTTPNGLEYPVTGRSGEWLRILWNGREAWIHQDLGQQAGDYGSVPVVSINTISPTVTSEPTPTETAPTVQAYSFTTIPAQLQPEDHYPAFYIAVSQNNEPADGRWCIVYHDGQEVGRDRSIPHFDYNNKGTPWEDDDRRYNCEVKFSEYNPQNWIGTWVIELQDGAGTVVGRGDPFTLTQDMQQVWAEFFDLS